jgi:hypothetical protein
MRARETGCERKILWSGPAWLLTLLVAPDLFPALSSTVREQLPETKNNKKCKDEHQ